MCMRGAGFCYLWNVDCVVVEHTQQRLQLADVLPVLLAQVVVIVDLVGVLPPVFLLFRLPSQALDFSLERVHLKVQLVDARVQPLQQQQKPIIQASCLCNTCVFLCQFSHLEICFLSTLWKMPHMITNIPCFLSQILTVPKFWYHLAHSFSRKNVPFDFERLRAPSQSQKCHFSEKTKLKKWHQNSWHWQKSAQSSEIFVTSRGLC